VLEQISEVLEIFSQGSGVVILNTNVDEVYLK
jgi:hypothetical protein